MTAYCTRTDLEERFGPQEITDLGDADKVARAISDAGSIIDSLVGVRVALPLTAAPDRLRQLACDLARYLLYDDEAPSIVRERQAGAMEFLKRFADGRASLGLPEESRPVPTGGAAVRARPAVFTGDLIGRMP